MNQILGNTAEFLRAESFAVAGASTNRDKYGNRVFRALLDSGRTVFPLNPNAETVEERPAFKNLSDLPSVPKALSIVTAPTVTQTLIEEALELGVEHIWMQPGAEHSDASSSARKAGLNVIDDGSCILVLLATESA